MEIIMFGNLNIDEIEERMEISLSDDFKEKIKKYHEPITKNIAGNNVWHCYEFPKMIVCGSDEVAQMWADELSPVSHFIEGSWQIGVSN